MRCEEKTFFIKEYFLAFRKRIEHLDRFKRGFEEEALILCVVYIDQLASGRYYDGQEKSHQNFCRALSELSDDPFFGMIHPRRLSDLAQKRSSAVRDMIDQFIKDRSPQFLEQETFKQLIQHSVLPESDRASLIMNIWRASVASICYERIRCQAVHGPERNCTLTFDETIYEGKFGASVDYGRLRNALYEVFRKVESLSLQSGEWYGNPLYK